MSSAGRQLLGTPPGRWVELHRQRWPSERLAFQDAVGRLLSKALSGAAVVQLTDVEPGGPVHVELQAIEPSDRVALDLQIPERDEDGKPPGKGFDLQAVLLPAAVRSDPTWVMSQLPDAWVELSNLDAVVCELLLVPVMTDLAAIFRLRAGQGPQTDKGRADKLLRCHQAHEALGLRSELIRPLLDPTLRRDEVVAAREGLLLSWAGHPADIGERAMALLCARLANAYYAKARKDGTVQEARVINTRTTPVLEVTLRDWDSLVAYLGEGLSTADARPVAIPEVVLPQRPPEPIIERIRVLRDWWRLYDARRGAQRPGDGLEDLVPPRWHYTDPADGDSQRPKGEPYRSWLPADLVDRIERLWGTTILARQPGALITEPHPFVRFGQLLRPAVEVWDELLTTCWSLCCAGYARYPLDQLQEEHAQARRELEKLGAPIDTSVYQELCEVGKGHAWLFEPQGLGMKVVISLTEEGKVTVGDGRTAPAEAAPVFLTLRAAVDVHRRRWLDDHLDPMLDAMWRADVGGGAAAYWKRLRGKGSAPTIKQALPDVVEAAQRWFNGDYGALARVAGLWGPISESPLPTDRHLPPDLPRLHNEIAGILGSSVRADVLEPRETLHRVSELAARSDDILVYWQAAGSAPPRSAIFGSGYSWLFDKVFGCDIEEGYKLLLAATREALARSGHSAARDLEIV